MTTEFIQGLTDTEVNQLPVKYTPIQYPLSQSFQGDLAHRDPSTIISILGNVSNKTYDSLQARTTLPFELNAHLERYSSQVEGFRGYVANTVNYPPFAAEHIASRYLAADTRSEGKSVIERIAERIKTSNGYRIDISDFDGTITEDPDQYLRPGFPGGHLVEDLLDELSMDKVMEVFVQTQRGIYTEAPWIFRLAGQQPLAEFRKGIEEYFNEFRGRRKIILSCQFTPFILGSLDRLPADTVEGVEVWGLGDENAVSPEKALIIEHIAKNNPRDTVHYLGDGSSDLKAISPLVGYYHALRGGKFEKELQRRGMLYLPYTSFNDVLAHEQELQYLVA